MLQSSAMHLKIILGLILSNIAFSSSIVDQNAPSGVHFHEISDDRWEEIQNGQWLIGIFHQDSPQSVTLEQDWNIFALKCQEFGIKVGMIKAQENPELQVRFLAKEFPKVFFIEDGTVRVFPTPTRDALVRIIKDKLWSELQHVSKFSNPFSVHLSLFSYLCSRALLLYNYEKQLISKFSSSPNIVNAAFGLTFIFFGTALGLMFSCLYQVLKFAVLCSVRKNTSNGLVEKSKKDETDSGNEAKASEISKHHNPMKGRTKLRKRNL